MEFISQYFQTHNIKYLSLLDIRMLLQSRMQSPMPILCSTNNTVKDMEKKTQRQNSLKKFSLKFQGFFV